MTGALPRTFDRATTPNRKIGRESAGVACYGRRVGTTLQDLLPLLQSIAAERTRATSLGELAELAQRSPSHFQRTFSQLVGESPKRYDTRLRLEAGAMLLVCTDTAILDVALGVGFDSHEGFTRAFRTRFGASPRDFRSAHAHLSPAALDRHASVIRHVGPCIGLYRMSTTPDFSDAS